MLQRLTRALRRSEGFTLLEVLVVIAILGVIAALITPKFLETMKDAKIDTAKASGKQIQMALERYKFQHDKYPTTDDADTWGEFQPLVGAYITLDGTTALVWPDTTDNGYDNTAEVFTVKLVIKGTDKCLRVTPTTIDTVDSDDSTSCD